MKNSKRRFFLHGSTCIDPLLLTQHTAEYIGRAAVKYQVVWSAWLQQHRCAGWINDRLDLRLRAVNVPPQYRSAAECLSFRPATRYSTSLWRDDATKDSRKWRNGVEVMEKDCMEDMPAIRRCCWVIRAERQSQARIQQDTWMRLWAAVTTVENIKNKRATEQTCNLSSRCTACCTTWRSTTPHITNWWSNGDWA